LGRQRPETRVTNPLRAQGLARLSLLIGLVIALLSLHHSVPLGALAQGVEPIRVLATDIKNDYPNSLTFRIRAEADQPIVQIEVY
jgi:hypothetical protein